MRIVMLGIGTYGDVQPYLALGLGLQKAGHQVRLATHRTFRDYVVNRGLEFAAIESDPCALMLGQGSSLAMEATQDFCSWIARISRVAEPIIHRLFFDCWQASQGAEAIVYSPLGCAGYSIAQRLGVPCYAGFLQPASRTRAFPAVWLPTRIPLGESGNWLTHLLVEQVFWQTFRKPINRLRQETLDIPPIPLVGPFGSPGFKRQPFLYGYSPAVFPRPRDWPDWIDVTGYWYLDRPDDWHPPKDLVDFLAAGPPPVYVGFGSMPEREPGALTTIILESLALTGRRAILQAGWSKLGDLDLPEPDKVMQIEWIPHDWLFPQMAAVVHHGGAGTTAAGIRAGVPSIVIPWFGDQEFWGRCVARMGIGPAPICRKQLSAERLASAIHTATHDERMRACAESWGRRIRTENGVARAVQVFHRHLHAPRSFWTSPP